MNAKELRQLNSRYVRIILDGDSERYINANFDALLEYIGSRFPLEGRTSIGSAYVRIRKETDRLLQVSWRENWSLKTSKREIKSIRQSSYWLPEKRGQHYYIMIPYKIGFIFTAIVNIVSEISQKESIPSSLPLIASMSLSWRRWTCSVFSPVVSVMVSAPWVWTRGAA